MATDLTTVNLAVAARRVTLNATATNCTAATIGKNVRLLTVQFFQSDDATPTSGKVAFDGATEGGALGNDFIAVAAGETVEISLHPHEGPAGNVTVYLTAATASAYAHLGLEWAGRGGA